jgi:hypothetical protein
MWAILINSVTSRYFLHIRNEVKEKENLEFAPCTPFLPPAVVLTQRPMSHPNPKI